MKFKGKIFVLLSCLIIIDTTFAVVEVQNLLNYAVKQYSVVAESLKCINNEFIHTGDLLSSSWHRNQPGAWTAGFYSGTLWMLYKLTKDEYWKTRAIENQEGVRHRQNDTGTHDVGFVIMSSFGLGLELTDEKDYIPVIVQTAKSLSTRYHPLAKVIRSWNNDDAHGGVEGEVKVIADNMMNLELLFRATELTNDETFKTIALSHADQTIRNHFRPNNEGTFHVVAYNETDGSVQRRYNWQGYADNSTWARGLAWIIHGYATTYHFTETPIYLEYAEIAAKYYLDNLPPDSIPYFDFDCPYETEYQPRDTSAAAITAHGLLKLHILTENPVYFEAAEKMLNSLASPDYRADGKAEYKLPAILANGTVFYHEDNVNTAIVYADFYFLQALDLYQQISGASPNILNGGVLVFTFITTYFTYIS